MSRDGLRSSTATLAYYERCAEDYVAQTQAADMRALHEAFLARVRPGGRLLDLGCGSGRDSKAFLERGYEGVAMDGAPREVFAQVEKLKSIGLTVPDTVELLYELRGAGCDLPLTAITVDECADAIARCFGKSAKEDN